MADASDHFVVYGDVLGFRDLVLTHQTVQPESLTYRRSGARFMAASLAHGNPLQRQLKNFHAKLDDAVFNTEWSAEVSVMVFSDSVFVATTNGKSCMDFCQRLLCDCIDGEIPLRMGVGYGTFVSNSFAFEAVPQAKVITSQFLGTGVVYAVGAEKAIKGMRIALHPTAATALAGISERQDRCLALSAEQLKENASHEWNFLPSHTIGNAKLSANRNELLRHVENMRVRSPDYAKIHYVETVAAVTRMTTQMHSEWLKPGERPRF